MGRELSLQTMPECVGYHRIYPLSPILFCLAIQPHLKALEIPSSVRFVA